MNTPNMLTGSKPLRQSKTFMGILIMLAAQAATLSGVSVTPDDVSAITDNTDQLITGATTVMDTLNHIQYMA